METKNRPRTILLATAAGLAVALGAASCTGGTTDAEPDSLELWLPAPIGSDAAGAQSEQETWEEIVAPFEEEHDIDVNVTLTPWANYVEKYLTGVSGGAGPDLGWMYMEMIGDYVAEDSIVPFDDYLDDVFVDKMLYLEQGQADGKQYALPMAAAGMRVLYANMDILEEAGVTAIPTTWAEFEDTATKVTESGNTAVLQQWGADHNAILNSTFIPLLWQAGGELFTEDGTATAFNDEAGLAAAQFLQDLIDSGNMPDYVSGISREEMLASFYAGEVAFVFDTEQQAVAMEDADINFDFIPGLTNERQMTFVASDSLVLLDKCPDKQLCTDLAEHLLDGEQMAKFHEEIVDYPPIGSDEPAQTDSIFAEAYEHPEKLQSFPIVAGSGAAYNALQENLQQMIIGQKTPEEAIADAAAAGDAALLRSAN